MEAGAQGLADTLTSVEKGANAIADRILAATEPWDVLCFNEVFDEDGRKILEHRLHTACPSSVIKADAEDRGNDENAANGVVYAQLALPDESPFNIMISHTQAGPLDDIGKEAVTRKAQFTTAMALLDNRLSSDYLDQEILFCGISTCRAWPTPTACAANGRTCRVHRTPRR